MAFNSTTDYVDTTSRTYRRVMSATSLAGDRVYNRAGDDLGKLTDIMIDVPTGRIAYGVLSFGGFLGMGDKLFAVPWKRLSVDEDNKRFILDVSKETLERAPGFDKDNWPDMADPSWSSQIHTHYGVEPYWEPESSITGSRRDPTPPL
jgi:sporulation protein YlmC with PRC-barrel domain